MSNSTQPIPSFRVGMGYDVHKLVEGRDLYLGGIKIEHTLGLLGHSDADVLIHAICDALLGAANMRDIGYHFPRHLCWHTRYGLKGHSSQDHWPLGNKGLSSRKHRCYSMCRTSKDKPTYPCYVQVLGWHYRLRRRCRIYQGHHFRAHGLRWARRGHGCLRCMPYCERLIITA